MFVLDAVRAVSEMCRVLKYGGELCVVTWDIGKVQWVTRINRSVTAIKSDWKRGRPATALADSAASHPPSLSRPPPPPSLAGSYSTSDSLVALLAAGGFAASDVRIRSVQHAVRVDDAAAFFDLCVSSLPSLIELSRMLSAEEREQVRNHFVQSLHSEQAAAGGQPLNLSAEAWMALAVKHETREDERR